MDIKTYVNRWFEESNYFMTKQFYSQIHLTRACEYSCDHCYFKEIPGKPNTHLNINVIKKIIDDTKITSRKLGLIPRVDFTGGDPLLHPDFFSIAQYTASQNIPFGLKGNPDFLLDSDIRKELKKLNISSISLSLDGLEKIQDNLRGQGSFNKTISCIGILKEEGFVVKVHSTVSRFNIDQLLPILFFFVNNRFIIDNWTWSRFWTINDVNDMISDQQIDRSFELIIDAYSKLLSKGDFFYSNSNGDLVPRIILGFKEHLWFPYLYSKGFISNDIADNIITSTNSVNCTATKHVYIIDSNGEVYKCRKIIESRIGNIISDPFEIIINSDTAILFNNLKDHSKCGSCFLFNGCGGCAAISLAKKKSVFERDPDCRFQYYSNLR